MIVGEVETKEVERGGELTVDPNEVIERVNDIFDDPSVEISSEGGVSLAERGGMVIARRFEDTVEPAYTLVGHPSGGDKLYLTIKPIKVGGEITEIGFKLKSGEHVIEQPASSGNLEEIKLIGDKTTLDVVESDLLGG
jgi:hypothetical protein